MNNIIYYTFPVTDPNPISCKQSQSLIYNRAAIFSALETLQILVLSEINTQRGLFLNNIQSIINGSVVAWIRH